MSSHESNARGYSINGPLQDIENKEAFPSQGGHHQHSFSHTLQGSSRSQGSSYEREPSFLSQGANRSLEEQRNGVESEKEKDRAVPDAIPLVKNSSIILYGEASDAAENTDLLTAGTTTEMPYISDFKTTRLLLVLVILCLVAACAVIMVLVGRDRRGKD
eukprot:gb/GECG01012939.1/.p1 GENE.gb/GECG01012939.1/~~gb/GECG01012939.1/.p1  ORF type:complete len:160 (+),score=17.30 gb/GECG01012939.1/:1-480(+)